MNNPRSREELIALLGRATASWLSVLAAGTGSVTFAPFDGEALVDLFLNRYNLAIADECIGFLLDGNGTHMCSSFIASVGLPIHGLRRDDIVHEFDILNQAVAMTIMERGGVELGDGRWVSCHPKRRIGAHRVMRELAKT